MIEVKALQQQLNDHEKALVELLDEQVGNRINIGRRHLQNR